MVPGQSKERALPLQFSTDTDMDAVTYSGLNCLRAHPATRWPGAQSFPMPRSGGFTGSE